jgi:hypothetical protein
MKANGKTQTDSNMNFDGMERMAPSRSTKYMTNHHTGTMNDGKLINKGRGPTGGGTAKPSCGKEMFAGKPQVRQAVSDGQTTSMPKIGRESFNFGRGPTKGNQK